VQEHNLRRLEAVEDLAHTLAVEQQLVATPFRVVPNDVVAIVHETRLVVLT
jgi:hypothetical protein